LVLPDFYAVHGGSNGFTTSYTQAFGHAGLRMDSGSGRFAVVRGSEERSGELVKWGGATGCSEVKADSLAELGNVSCESKAAFLGVPPECPLFPIAVIGGTKVNGGFVPTADAQ
jgi:hypothetical protein